MAKKLDRNRRVWSQGQLIAAVNSIAGVVDVLTEDGDQDALVRKLTRLQNQLGNRRRDIENIPVD